MGSVRVRLNQARLSADMVEMRCWLDRNQHDPMRFDCHQNGDEILVCIEFSRKEAAQAFAKRFDGEIRSASTLAATAYNT